jgi:flagellar protein FlaI
MDTKKLLRKYKISADFVPARVTIFKEKEKFVPTYVLSLPKIEKATKAILDQVQQKLISEVQVGTAELLDPRASEKIKQNFANKAKSTLIEEIPNIPDSTANILIGFLLHEMLGLGTIELLLKDDRLEEIVINSSNEFIWAYHKEFGWVKTNIRIPTESQIENYSSLIGRRVGRQITVLRPLMDAHLITGDRVNATLFPISTHGNTMTIRKFRRKPWTITEMLKSKTITPEVASTLWLAFEYEMSMIVSGGTASGKTTALNVMMPFIPPNQRILSIEDTRELRLPDFLHWVPLTTREPNPEGKGGVTMLDLLINSLRMRPDRIVVGEIRRQREAEVLFEAMHTGHSVYATLHADTAEQTIRRLTSPPINLPAEMLETLPLITVMFRQRRLGIRRVFQVAEIMGATSKTGEVDLNILYRWRARRDTIDKENPSIRLFQNLEMYTGMTKDEMEKDIAEKSEILQWMQKRNINTVNTVGKIVSSYYIDKEKIIRYARKNESPNKLLGEFVKELRKEVDEDSKKHGRKKTSHKTESTSDETSNSTDSTDSSENSVGDHNA